MIGGTIQNHYCKGVNMFIALFKVAFLHVALLGLDFHTSLKGLFEELQFVTPPQPLGADRPPDTLSQLSGSMLSRPGRAWLDG